MLIGLPVLYVASFGPACWATYRYKSLGRPVIEIYSPVFDYALDLDAIYEERLVPTAMRRYMLWGVPRGMLPAVTRGGLRWHYCPG